MQTELNEDQTKEILSKIKDLEISKNWYYTGIESGLTSYCMELDPENLLVREIFEQKDKAWNNCVKFESLEEAVNEILDVSDRIAKENKKSMHKGIPVIHLTKTNGFNQVHIINWYKYHDKDAYENMLDQDPDLLSEVIK